jgi:hypothetical protein
MTDTGLNNHHRDTLTSLFAHPTSHNLRWVDVLSLVSAVGVVEEKHDGRTRLEIAGQVEVFDVHHHKDLSTQEVVDLRHMLTNAGYGPAEGKPAGTED